MTPEQERTLARLREHLADEPTLEDKPMFGVRACMVNGRLLVCAQKDGGLLVRVAAERADELVRRPGATQAEMGERSMGPGWLVVEPSAIADDVALDAWLVVALEHNRAVAGS